MAESKRKRGIICISSSSDDDDDHDEAIGERSSSSGSDGSDWNEDEEDASVDYGSHGKENSDSVDDDDDSRCNRVVFLLQEGNDLEALNLRECKAYLRKHGLRIAGSKAVCIQRIKEHWRIRNGGEAHYPRSSFFINCTGDVCKGDVVLFTQKVYDKFDKVSRHGKLQGMRTVAGRVVKESYGAAKQQHTFTIEVLWSKGIKKLPPLFPLLVKGRNLYRLRTYRQRWNNEAERLQVLAEKHKRGSAARFVRATKKNKKTLSTNGAAKRQKHTHRTEPLQLRKTTEANNKKHTGSGKATSQGHIKFSNQTVAHSVEERNLKCTARSSRASEYPHRHQRLTHPTTVRGSTHVSHMHHHSQNPHQAQMHFHPTIEPSHYSIPNMKRTPPFIPYTTNAFAMPPSQYQCFNYSNRPDHSYSNPRYEFEPRY